MSSRAKELAGAVAMIAWNGIAVIGLSILLVKELAAPTRPLAILDAVSHAVAIIWLALQIYFLCVRTPPIRKSSGWLPRMTALAGAHVAVVIVLLPPNKFSTLHAISAVIATVGMAGSIYTLAYLGRAFSVFPQARRLTMTGPYRYVRHPLYLFEAVTVLGISLLYEQPFGLIIALGSIAAQIPRMSYEEEVLRHVFPDYAQYETNSWRLIPRLY